MPNHEDLIPTTEAAEVLGVHIRTVHRLVLDGRLHPAVRAPGLRGALLFDRRDVQLLRIERESGDAA